MTTPRLRSLALALAAPATVSLGLSGTASAAVAPTELYKCSDFVRQSDAQVIYDANKTPNTADTTTNPDPLGLDVDKDGIACEELPVGTPVPTLAAVTSADVFVSANNGITRYGGSDRYETAVQISQAVFQPGVDTIYLASGRTYADALSTGAVAAKTNSPLLLTDATLPAVVQAEIQRLAPRRVVLVGGANTVTPAVESAVRALGVVVDRAAGKDRYETAYMVGANAFPEKPVMGYVTSGANFPDALSIGGTFFGTHTMPVFLTDPNALPIDTSRLIGAKAATRFYSVVGSENAVSERAAQMLPSRRGQVFTGDRISGADRYETSAKLASSHHGDITVILARGDNYPDALAGGSLSSALWSAPVLLVSRNAAGESCLPKPVFDYYNSRKPRATIILGSESAIGDGVTTRQC